MFRLIVSSLAAALLLVTCAPPLAAQQAQPRATATKKTAATVVNINSASASDLQQLPGIGAKTAARILEYRQKNGPFKKVEELMNVRGVGEKNFLKLKAQITVAAPKADHTQER